MRCPFKIEHSLIMTADHIDIKSCFLFDFLYRFFCIGNVSQRCCRKHVQLFHLRMRCNLLQRIQHIAGFSNSLSAQFPIVYIPDQSCSILVAEQRLDPILLQFVDHQPDRVRSHIDHTISHLLHLLLSLIVRFLLSYSSLF